MRDLARYGFAEACYVLSRCAYGLGCLCQRLKWGQSALDYFTSARKLAEIACDTLDR